MSRLPRKELIAEGEVGIYHCVQRAVRRAFLCGEDKYSGRNFDHRKVWIRERLEFLAGQFGIEVLGFAILSNHMHVILRNRPDVVAEWSDDEVARRWLMLYPQRRDESGAAESPNEFEISMITANPARLAEIRSRLSSLSWFMRNVAEPIARRANREDECSGRFWEGRYKCQRLLDEAAVLTCGIYVDLNPIRAGIAATPEESEFTSAFERIQGNGEWMSPVELGGGLAADDADERRCEKSPSPPAPLPGSPGRGEPGFDGKNSGFDGKNAEFNCKIEEAKGESGDKSPHSKMGKGFLSMSWDEYLKLLDWTGRQIRRGKSGVIPAELAPILERLQLSGETWVESVKTFGKTYHRAAGCAASLEREASRVGRKWFAGIRSSRRSFSMPRPAAALEDGRAEADTATM